MTREWRETTLGEVADFLSGGTPSKGNASYWGGTVPWVSAKDMKRFVLADTLDHLTEDGVRNGTKLVPERTVFLLTRGMTLLNDVPISVARRPMTFNQDVKGLRPKEGVNADFLPYLVLGHKQRLLDLVDLAGHGTGRLNTDELKSLDVLLPPEPEQFAIADFLGKLNDKVELNRHMNETLEAMARAIFKSWFVDFDPVRAKAEGRQPFGMDAETAALFPDRFVESPLCKIPIGWKVYSLDEIAHFLNGLALQKYPQSGGESLPVIKIAQLRKGNTEDADQAAANLPPEYVVQDGDILFSWSGSLEVVIWCGGRGALNQHLFKVTSRNYPKWFYYSWIQEHLSDFQAIASGKATTMGHIQRHHLTEAKVLVPPAKLLGAMDKILRPMLQAIIEKNIQSHTLASIREALLPKLISGEIRVPA